MIFQVNTGKEMKIALRNHLLLSVKISLRPLSRFVQCYDRGTSRGWAMERRHSPKQNGNLSLSFSIVVVLSREGDKQLKSGKLVADGALDTKQTLESFDRSFSRWHHLTTAINFELSFLNRLHLREVRVRFSNLVTQ